MKFAVVFVNEGNLANVGPEQKKTINKVLKYELPKNTDLALHVLNIHKSLCTIGYPLQDAPQHFTLRFKPVTQTELKIFPAYLEESGPEIDAQILHLISQLTKPQKRKGYVLELVLTPESRAQRFIKVLKDNSVSPLKLKETAFNLVSQTKDPVFSEVFVNEGGIKALLSLLDIAKGNTIAYAVNALGASLQGNEMGLKALLKDGGIGKLFKIIESPVLSIARRAMEVLHHICYTDDTWKLFYETASQNENQGIFSVLNHLESVDLHTRLAALRIVNKMIENAPPDMKQEIIEIVIENNAPLSLQKSLGITAPEVMRALRRFEVATGIVLSKVGGTGQVLKQRVKQLEEEVATLQAKKRTYSDPVVTQSKQTKQEIQEKQEELGVLHPSFDLDSLENEIGELSFDTIDFSLDLRSSDLTAPMFESITAENDADIIHLESPRSAEAMLKRNLSEAALPRTTAGTKDKEITKQLETVQNEKKQLEEELEKVKKDSESAIITKKELQILRAELERVKAENVTFTTKITSLNDTVQGLINEVNPTIACEHCINEPGMVFHLDVQNRVRNSTVITPLSMKRCEISKNIDGEDVNLKLDAAVVEGNAELEKQRNSLQEAVDDLQQQKYSIEMDKYQLSIDVDNLKEEYDAGKQKKKKLHQVVQSLHAKRTVLMKDCEDARKTKQQLKEEIQTYKDAETKMLADIHVDEHMEPLTSTNDAAADQNLQIKRMQTIIATLTKQKRELEQKLEQ